MISARSAVIESTCRRRSPSHSDPQFYLGDLRPAPDALLNAEQHLDDHQHRQRAQVHLPGLGHARFAGSPPVGIHLGVGGQRCPPALVVGVAVAARAVGRPSARRHRACGHRRQRSHSRVGQELLHRHRWSPQAELLGVRLAQHRVPHRRHAPASRHRAPTRGRGFGRKACGSGDLGRAHPQPSQAREAPITHRETGTDRVLASLDPAHRPAQQSMRRRQRQHPRPRIPPRLVQESAVEHRRQTRGRADQHDPVQHMRELAAVLLGRDSFSQPHGGHRVTSACSRGLGTASTAARSREESGCR